MANHQAIKSVALVEDEGVILAVNDHWAALLRHFVGLIMAWILFFVVLGFTSWLSAYSKVSANVIILIAVAILTILNHWFFLYVIQWNLSNWFITTHRIIEFDNKPFVQNDMRFVKISEIHEVEQIRHGLLRNIFDYGDVIINVAAVPEAMHFKYVPQPSKFLHLIQVIRNEKLHHELNLPDLRQKYGRKYRFIHEIRRRK